MAVIVALNAAAGVILAVEGMHVALLLVGSVLLVLLFVHDTSLPAAGRVEPGYAPMLERANLGR